MPVVLAVLPGDPKVPTLIVNRVYPFNMVAVDTFHITTLGSRKEYFLVVVKFLTKLVKVKAVTAKIGFQIDPFIQERFLF